MTSIKKIFFFLIAFSSFYLISFKLIEPDKKAAVVSQVEGVSVFILSEPREAYNFIATIKKGFALSGSNEEMITGLAKKARKDFPNCDAIIFHGYEFEKCDVIKFK